MHKLTAITIIIISTIFLSSCNKQSTISEKQDIEKSSLKELTPQKGEIETAAQKKEEEKVEKTTIDKPIKGIKSKPVRKYIIKKGDTLYGIARKFYGDVKYWRKIWQVNIDKIPDPNKIPIGIKIIIP